MTRRELGAGWQDEVDGVLTGMKEWRLQHARATFQEIEAALDAHLARVRARMLQDLALASAATTVDDGLDGERPACARCGQPMEARGEQTRTLTTNHNQPITLTRSYAFCPACEVGLFPPG